MSSALDLELAHDGAMRCASLLNRLLAPAIFYSNGGFVCRQEGTDGDTADRLAEKITEALIYIKIDRNAIAACSNALTIANKNLTPAGTRAGLKVGETNFCHAHEAIVETLALVALHFKSFSEDLDEPHYVNDETIDVAILRENLEEACSSISHEPYFLTHADIDQLERDARQEFAEALNSVAHLNSVAGVVAPPAAEELVIEDGNGRRNGKWAKVHALLDNEPDADSWDDGKRRQKVDEWNTSYGVSLTVSKLGQLIRDRRKRHQNDVD